MADPWGGIVSTIYRSKKFRPLDDLSRMAYIYAHTCPHRNAIGLYRLPVLWMADDLDRPPDKIKGALDNLQRANLIDYCEEESLVRVLNWEKLNGADGPQEAIGRMSRMFDSAPDHDFTIAAFICFMHDVLHKALGTAKAGDGWNLTDARSKMEGMIFHRLIAYYKADRPGFIRSLKLSGIDGGDVVFNDLWHRVSDTQTIPYDIPTRYTDTDTDMDKDTDKDTHTDSDRDTDKKKGQRKISGKMTSSPPPSPPADGGQSGGKNVVPEDIQQTIASLGQGKRVK